MQLKESGASSGSDIEKGFSRRGLQGGDVESPLRQFQSVYESKPSSRDARVSDLLASQGPINDIFMAAAGSIGAAAGGDGSVGGAGASSDAEAMLASSPHREKPPSPTPIETLGLHSTPVKGDADDFSSFLDDFI
jgi:hypothetical protein